MPQDQPGQIGPYQIEGILGRGATSVVYRGLSPHEGRSAAIKLLLAEVMADGERASSLARFHREAELCRQLDHPNVVRVFASGDFDGNPFLAMELLDGRSLADVLRGPRLPPQQAVALVIALLEALSHVHAHRIIHRDIKPANMIMRDDGRLTLVDFGIAHLGGSDITQLGDMLGSPAYMSPEQLSGRAVDARADLFATGVVLYALLTRQRPFSGTVASVMQAILHEAPLPPSHHLPELPAVVDTVMARALAKEPDARFQSAAEFASALRALLPQLEATASPVARPTAADDAAPDPQAMAALVDQAMQAALDGVSTLDEGLIVRLEAGEGHWKPGDTALRVAFAPRMENWPAELSALIDRIVAFAPLPESRRPVRGDWMALVRFAAVSLRLLHKLDQTALARSHHRRLSDELAEPFIVYVDIAGTLLARSENPDLDRLSMGLMRLDVLELALETIAAPAELRLARKTRMLVAIQAMRKVNEAVSAYTSTRDMMARFDVAMIMNEVEALIAIAGRLTDDSGVSAGRQLGETAQGVIHDFIGGAEELVQLTVDELSESDLPGGQRVFSAKLRQLRGLHHLVVRLPGQQHRALIGRLTGAMHEKITGLARALLTRPETDDALSEIFELAEAHGWQALAAEILGHLKSRNTSEFTAR